jgi:two-component system cell cycle sensor histidine kinase/response regulator CckA
MPFSSPLSRSAVGQGPPRAWRLPLSLAVFSLLVILARGDLPRDLAPPKSTLTTIGQFWTCLHEQPQQRQTLRLEFSVLFYDPGWNLLWGSQGDMSAFLPTVAGRPLPLKSGQRVRLTGTVVPATGFVPDEVEVTVLAENVWPAAISSEGLLARAGQLEARWTEVEGVICSQHESDPTHFRYALLAEDWLVHVRVPIPPGNPAPQLVSTRVRVRGVYVGSKDPAGALQRIELWVPSPHHIETIGPLQADPRFSLPRTTIGGLGQATADGWLRIFAKVLRHEAGKELVVRDDTGQLLVRTPQPGQLAAGDEIDLIGRRAGEGPEWTLRDAVFRRVVRPAPLQKPGTVSEPTKLRIAAQVMELRPEEVGQGLAAEITGVVTWAHPAASFFYLADASGGICVRLQGTAVPPTVGEGIALRGVTRTGAFAPELTLQALLPVGGLTIPPARSVTLEQAMTGAEEARRVELRGYLRQLEPEGPWVRLDFTTATGEFSAFAPPHPDFSRLVGAVVRVAGVCAAESNARHELTGVRLWVNDPQSITIEAPPTADPFTAPMRTIASLRRFAARDVIDRRVRIVGTVTRHVPGRALFVQDGDAGLLVLSRETTPAEPGDRIEVVGFPGREGSRVVLRAASWRRTAPAGEAPVPLELDPALPLQPELDARLVRVRGTITEVALRADETRLILRESGRFFEAQVPETGPVPSARIGGVVELTGIYSLQFDEARRPRRFTVLMRSPSDVALIIAPPWWTAARMTIAGALLLFLSLVAASWVVVLRRRVARQTEQIRTQVANEARLQTELERSSRLESLGVLAGGIAHDFNNLLTAIIGNLGLVALDDSVMRQVGHNVREAQRAAKRASDVTQQLLTFAKGGDPVREAVLLSEVVQEAATFALHGAKVGSEFLCPRDLPAAHADAGQISRVVHNLVLNAVQAMPEGGLVKLALTAVEVAPGEIATLAPGRYVQLSVADNGPGISPENLQRLFEPYFSTKGRNSGLGLATVHSIVKKHQGHIAVESHPGRGTTFRVWLPVAREAPTARPTPPAPAVASRALRVLLMDDEDIIRRVASALFQRLGHSVTTVPDGAEALRTYAAAQAAREPFDLVILDLTVPGGMGGLEALAQLRAIDPHVRAVASSGYSSDPVLANYQAHGFRAILPKPYDLKALSHLLDQARNL